MILSRAGGTAAILGGIGWLLVFGPGVEDSPVGWLDDALWVFPVAFGLATIALWTANPSRLDRAAAWTAGATAFASALVSIVGTAVLTSGAPAYAAWLVWIGGIVVLCGLAVLYGIRHGRDRAERPVAWIALAAGGLPFAFFILILGYKIATGWWVTDPSLIAFGTVGAAMLVGCAWVAIGIALWMRPGNAALDAPPAVG